MKNIRLILILGWLLLIGRQAVAQVNVSLDNTTAEMGDSVVVPISVASVTGRNIIAYQSSLNYDTNILTFKRVSTTGTVSQSWENPTINAHTAGKIVIAGYGTTPLSGQGKLVNLHFLVIGQPGTSSDLTFQSFLFNNNSPTVNLTPGKFTVKLVPIQVVVTTNWGGGEVMVDGVTHPAPYQATWYKQQSHEIGINSEYLANAGTRYLFKSWRDNPQRVHTVTPVSDFTYVADLDLQYLLTINQDYGRSQGGGWQNAGSAVQISVDSVVTIDPEIRGRFQGWQGSGAGSYTGTLNPATVVMNGPITETIQWIPRYHLSIQTTHGTPIGDGWYTAGTSVKIEIDSLVIIPEQEQHRFSSWSGAGNGAYSGATRRASVIVNNPLVETVNWQSQYFLTTQVNVADRGTIVPAPPGAWYPVGTEVPVSAAANNGFAFTNWSGSLSGSTNPTTVRMSRAKHVTANFGTEVPITFVTKPAGLKVLLDGVEYQTPITVKWISGVTHQLGVNSPQTNSTTQYMFQSWSDAGASTHTFTTPAASQTLSANFTTQYYLTTRIMPSGSGTITPASPGTWADAASTVSVSATAQSGYVFSAWSGDTTATTNPLPTKMYRAKSLQANFVEILQIQTTTLPKGLFNSPYVSTIVTKGGQTPLTWRISSGALPGGLTLDPNAGKISGVPNVFGEFSFTVQVSDSKQPAQKMTQNYTLLIQEFAILFADDFNDGNFNGWTVVDEGSNYRPSAWKVPNGTLGQTSEIWGGAYEPSSPNKPGTFLYYPGADWRDYEFSAQLNSSHYHALGIMFRYRDQNNYYLFTMDSKDQYRRLVKKEAGVYSILAADNFSFAMNKWYPVVATVNGSQIQITFDGKVIFSVKDTALNGGGIALYSWKNRGSYFDDITVKEIQQVPLAIITSTLADATVNEAYSVTFVAAGGTIPYSWSLNSGALPTGLTLNAASGLLAGTPQSAGNNSFSIKVVDSAVPAATSLTQFSLTVQPPPPLTIKTVTLTSGTIGKSYSTALTAEGGVKPYQWTLSNGPLPTGLVLNRATGQISGTPTQIGNFPITVRVTDSANPATQVSQNLTLTIETLPPVQITTSSLSGGTVGTAYSTTLTAANGTTPYTWQIQSGTLPAGLTLNSSSGVISGTPTSTGTYSVVLQVTDKTTPAGTDSRAFSITIQGVTILLNESFSQGTFKGWTIVDEGTNLAPSLWSVAGGILIQNSNIFGLPKEAIYLDKPGTFLFWPATWENYELTLKINSGDDDGIGVMFRYQDRSNYYRLMMNRQDKYRRLSKKVAGQDVKLAEDSFAYTSNVWYQVKIVALGDVIEVYYDNVLVFKVTDSAIKTGGIALYSWSNEKSYYDEILVKALQAGPTPLQFTTSSLTAGTVGVSYTAMLGVSGGTSPYQWERTSGALPTGLNLNTGTGGLSGTPTQAGDFNFTARVTDASKPAQQVSQSFTLKITTPPALTIATTALNTGLAGQAYLDTLIAINGKSPYTWSVLAGNLPTGISLHATTGILSGTTMTSGSNSITFQVRDSGTPTQEATRELTLKINTRPPLQITTAELAKGTLETPYTAQLAATGGLSPYVWSLKTGNLPPGLTLETNTGQITGQPTTAGTFEFTVQVKDKQAPPDSLAKGLAITVSQMQTYLTEEFSDGNFDGWIVVDEGTRRAPSKWSVYWNWLEQSSEIYDNDTRVDRPQKLGTYLYWQDLSWTDFDAAVSLRSDETDAIGVMFRYQDPNNYYRFSMDQNQQYRRLIRKFQGEVTVLAAESFVYVNNHWYDVKIRALGSQLTVTLDNRQVFAVTDDKLNRGGIALYCWYNSKAKFDNIVVTTPNLGKARPSLPSNKEVVAELPKKYQLYQNYPNPFNPATQIAIDLPSASTLSLKIYNLLGAEIQVLWDAPIEAGRPTFTWDGRNKLDEVVPAGIYLYRVIIRDPSGQQPAIIETKKMVFMK
ncbi:putative Ig domain-containing protein [candidate division KSB1 bacterium]|nr:putative Ig domain-containing protein [candidate division KSB1 bacterium]